VTKKPSKETELEFWKRMAAGWKAAASQYAELCNRFEAIIDRELPDLVKTAQHRAMCEIARESAKAFEPTQSKPPRRARR